jgi:hypothetical protein
MSNDAVLVFRTVCPHCTASLRASPHCPEYSKKCYSTPQQGEKAESKIHTITSELTWAITVDH